MLHSSKLWELFKLLFLSLLVSSCSGETITGEEAYFTADIEGEHFEVNDFSGTIQSEKRVSDLGTVDLAMKVESVKGGTVEFLIRNYDGTKTYLIGKGIYNHSWIKYSQKNPVGSWSSKTAIGNSPIINGIDITADNGDFISGHLSFEGHDTILHTSKMISQGNFNINVHRGN